MAHSCPLGNTPKPISIYDDSILRKDGNGTSMVAIAKYPATHTKALPKFVAPNLRGPKIVWVPSKKWMIVCRYHWHWRFGSNGIHLVNHVVEPSITK